MTDPISDLLTRIRNAGMRKLITTTAPYSKIKENILTILKEEGFIEDFTVNEKNNHKEFLITLRYKNNKSVINHVKRISKPGIRTYMGYKELKPILRGYGIGIISSPKGLITDKKARELKTGGEFICEVW